MQIIETMESTSAVPSRSSKRRNNGVMRNDENSGEPHFSCLQLTFFR